MSIGLWFQNGPNIENVIAYVLLGITLKSKWFMCIPQITVITAIE